MPPIKLHSTGSAPRPRHPSGAPTITPLKEKPYAAPWEPTEGSGSDSDSEGDSVPNHKYHGKGIAERMHAAIAEDEQRAVFSDNTEESQWEEEAADELASDMWMDELEFRMREVYARVGQQTAAKGNFRLPLDSSDDEAVEEGEDLSMPDAFEEELVPRARISFACFLHP
eukprot:SAG11_NODE_4478_length_1880_cov_2.595733_2_plen_170_part_00